MRAWTRIVVGYKASAEGRDALALGELLARTAGSGLLAVRVQSRHDQQDRPATDELEAELADALSTSSVGFRALVRANAAAPRALLDLAAAEADIGLIVLGSTHRAGIGRVMPGGAAERLLAGAPCSIAVAPRGYADSAPADANEPLADDLRVLAVGFDGSAEGKAALGLASTLAVAAGATLRVIAVGPRASVAAGLNPPASVGAPIVDLQAKLHEVVAALPEDLRALPVYEQGEAAHTLLERAEEGVDLLVIGSRGHGPVSSVLLGSTSSAVIAASPCPVVVVPRPALSTKP